ncbi:MAG: YdcF family protein [Alphaproteobacteria bacterium]|nr:YdcF family protein [Alphaproteobacteria bacterium]
MTTKLRKLLQLLVIATAAWLTLEICVITAIGLADTARTSDVAIVLGSKVNPDGSLSPRLQARLDRALALYQQKLVAHLIVSGGYGKEGHDEALVMKQYLLRQGIPEMALIADQHGDNTEATALNSMAIMQQHGWKSAIVVTQYFHIARSVWALRRVGIENVTSAHANYFETRDIYATLREAVACIAYLLH